jgi:hypothetical protein
VKRGKNMKGKTIRTLLISATMTAVTLTGCNSNDETLTSKNETATEEVSTTEFETYAVEKTTIEVETTTIEETTTESEITTTEVETSTIEETTTEEESSTSNSDDAATRRANYKSKYSLNYNSEENYEIYSWLDDDGDGVITDEEAAYLEDALDEMFSSKETSDSTTSSSSSSSSSSYSSQFDSYPTMSDELPKGTNASELDGTGLRTDLIVH